MRTAIITGVSGQDGYYLARFLTERGYTVVGTTRKVNSGGLLKAGSGKVHLVTVDLRDQAQIENVITTFKPDEVYNLAARSSSSQLFDDPIATADINATAVVRILEAIRKFSPKTRFFQASSSEVFAGAVISPQSETTPFCPVNAYGAAKVFAVNIVRAFREVYGLHASSAVLFNHESPFRGQEYVTRKISTAVAQINAGQRSELRLGSLDTRRDWGFAGDYVEAMWLMLQQEIADDYVLATGSTYSVRDFCETAFNHVGLDYRNYVTVDPSWTSRKERAELRGDASKANRKLGWRHKMDFVSLVKLMVDADLVRARRS